MRRPEEGAARVAKAVWPSCQRNSRVRMKGVGCLNSQRTTLVHWFRRSGRSRWLRIHCRRAHACRRQIRLNVQTPSFR